MQLTTKSPSQLNAVAWWKADTGLSGSGSSLTWTDQIGSRVLHNSGTGKNAPTLTIYNGRTTLYFSGADYSIQYDTDNYFSFLNNNTTQSTVVVFGYFASSNNFYDKEISTIFSVSDGDSVYSSGFQALGIKGFPQKASLTSSNGSNISYKDDNLTLDSAYGKCLWSRSDGYGKIQYGIDNDRSGYDTKLYSGSSTSKLFVGTSINENTGATFYVTHVIIFNTQLSENDLFSLRYYLHEQEQNKRSPTTLGATAWWDSNDDLINKNGINLTNPPGLLSTNTAIGETSGPITLSGLFYFKKFNPYALLISKAYRSNNTWAAPFISCDLLLNNDDRYFGLQVSIAGTQYSVFTTSAKITLETWCHIAGSFNPATGAVRLYLNGELVGTGTLTAASIDWGTHGPWYVGMGGGTTSNELGNYSDCIIDHVRVDHKLRTDDEIKYMNMKRLAIDANTSLFYDFTSYPYTNSGNDGTLNLIVGTNGSVSQAVTLKQWNDKGNNYNLLCSADVSKTKVVGLDAYRFSPKSFAYSQNIFSSALNNSSSFTLMFRGIIHGNGGSNVCGISRNLTTTNTLAISTSGKLANHVYANYDGYNTSYTNTFANDRIVYYFLEKTPTKIRLWQGLDYNNYVEQNITSNSVSDGYLFVGKFGDFTSSNFDVLDIACFNNTLSNVEVYDLLDYFDDAFVYPKSPYDLDANYWFDSRYNFDGTNWIDRINGLQVTKLAPSGWTSPTYTNNKDGYAINFEGNSTLISRPNDTIRGILGNGTIVTKASVGTNIRNPDIDINTQIHWKFNETFYPYSNSGYGGATNLSPQGSIVVGSTSGVFDNAISIPTTSQGQVLETGNSTVGQSNSITVSGWVLLLGYTAGPISSHIIGKYYSGNSWDSAPNGSLAMYIGSTGRLDCFVTVGGANRVLTSVTVALYRWHHVAMTYNATDGTLKLYLDGVQVATNTFGAGNIDWGSNGAWTVGGINYTLGNGRTVYGYIDDIRVDNIVRDISHLSGLYNRGLLSISNRSIPLDGYNNLWFKFNEASGGPYLNSGNAGALTMTVASGTVVSSVDGIYDKALRVISTTSGSVALTAATTVGNSNSVTVSLWLYPLAYPGSGNSTFVVKYYQGNNSWSAPYGFVFSISTSGGLNGGIVLNGTLRTIDYSPAAQIALNTWSLFTFTYDATTSIQKVYVNGNIINSMSWGFGNIEWGTGSWEVGGLNGYPANMFNGYVDNLVVDSVVREQDYIRKMYYNGLSSLYRVADIVTLTNCGDVEEIQINDGYTQLYWGFDDGLLSTQNAGAAGYLPLNNTTNGNFSLLSPGIIPGGNASRYAINSSGTASGLISAPTTKGESNSITMSAWVYPTGYTQYAPIIMKTYYSNSAVSAPYYTGIGLTDANNGSLQFIRCVGGTYQTHWISDPSTRLTLNRWNHVAMTYDATSGIMKCFLDGELVGWRKDPAGNLDWGTHGSWHVGGWYTGSSTASDRFVGAIDECRVDSIVRSEEYIRKLYNSTLNSWTWNPVPQRSYLALTMSAGNATSDNLKQDQNTSLHYEFNSLPAVNLGTASNLNMIAVGTVSIISEVFDKVLWNNSTYSNTISTVATSSGESNSITASVWVYITSYKGSGPIFGKFYNSDNSWSSPYMSIGVRLTAAANGLLTFYVTKGSGTILSFDSTISIPLNTWCLVTLSYDATTGLLKGYKNGNLIGSVSGTPANIDWGTHGSWFIAGNNLGAGVTTTDYVPGYYYGFTVDNVVRSNEYVLDTYRYNSTKYSLPDSNTAIVWNFNENSIPTNNLIKGNYLPLFKNNNGAGYLTKTKFGNSWFNNGFFGLLTNATTVGESLSLTASFRVFLTARSPNTNDSVLFGKYYNSSTVWTAPYCPYLILSSPTGIVTFLYTPASTNTLTSFTTTTTLALNVWYHIAFTYNAVNGNIKIYVNGTLIDSRTIATGGFHFGTHGGYFVGSLNNETSSGTLGFFADVRLDTVERSEAYIKNLYINTNFNYIDPNKFPQSIIPLQNGDKYYSSGNVALEFYDSSYSSGVNSVDDYNNLIKPIYEHRPYSIFASKISRYKENLDDRTGGLFIESDKNSTIITGIDPNALGNKGRLGTGIKLGSRGHKTNMISSMYHTVLFDNVLNYKDRDALDIFLKNNLDHILVSGENVPGFDSIFANSYKSPDELGAMAWWSASDNVSGTGSNFKWTDKINGYVFEVPPDAVPYENRQLPIDGYTQLWYKFEEATSPFTNSGNAGSLDLSNIGVSAVNRTDGLFNYGLNVVGVTGVKSASTSVGEINATGKITISAWVYVRSLPAASAPIVAKSNNNGWAAPYYSIGISLNANLNFYAQISRAGALTSYACGSAAIQKVDLNKWTFVCLTFDNATGALNFYKNGTLIYSTTTATTAIDWGTHGPWIIGDNTTDLEPFNGIIDDVRVEHIIRDATYVNTSYKRGIGIYSYVPIDANTLIHWKFDNSGTTWSNYGYGGSCDVNPYPGASMELYPGVYDNGLKTVGGSNYGARTAPTTVGHGNSMTISAWVYLVNYSRNGTEYPKLLIKTPTDGWSSPYIVAGFDIHNSSNNGGWWFNACVGNVRQTVYTTDLPTGQWVHIAGTYCSSNGVLKKYLNGKLVGTTSVTPGVQTWIGSGRWHMGSNGAGTDWTDYIIDDVRIDNIPRSDEYIQQLYDVGLLALNTQSTAKAKLPPTQIQFNGRTVLQFKSGNTLACNTTDFNFLGSNTADSAIFLVGTINGVGQIIHISNSGNLSLAGGEYTAIGTTTTTVNSITKTIPRLTGKFYTTSTAQVDDFTQIYLDGSNTNGGTLQFLYTRTNGNLRSWQVGTEDKISGSVSKIESSVYGTLNQLRIGDTFNAGLNNAPFNIQDIVIFRKYPTDRELTLLKNYYKYHTTFSSSKSPLEIGDLQNWWDASMGITGSGASLTWAPRSGSLNMTVRGANYPSVSSYEGTASLLFSNANQTGFATTDNSTNGQFTTAQQSTIVFVATTIGSAYGKLFQLMNLSSYSATNSGIIVTTTANGYNVRYKANGVESNILTTYYNGTYSKAMIVVSISGTNCVFTNAGSIPSNYSLGTVTAGRDVSSSLALCIGGEIAGSSVIQHVHHIATFNKALSDQEISDLKDYFIPKASTVLSPKNLGAKAWFNSSDLNDMNKTWVDRVSGKTLSKPVRPTITGEIYKELYNNLPVARLEGNFLLENYDAGTFWSSIVGANNSTILVEYASGINPTYIEPVTSNDYPTTAGVYNTTYDASGAITSEQIFLASTNDAGTPIGKSFTTIIGTNVSASTSVTQNNYINNYGEQSLQSTQLQDSPYGWSNNGIILTKTNKNTAAASLSIAQSSRNPASGWKGFIGSNNPDVCMSTRYIKNVVYFDKQISQYELEQIDNFFKLEQDKYAGLVLNSSASLIMDFSEISNEQRIMNNTTNFYQDFNEVGITSMTYSFNEGINSIYTLNNPYLSGTITIENANLTTNFDLLGSYTFTCSLSEHIITTINPDGSLTQEFSSGGAVDSIHTSEASANVTMVLDGDIISNYIISSPVFAKEIPIVGSTSLSYVLSNPNLAMIASMSTAGNIHFQPWGSVVMPMTFSNQAVIDFFENVNMQKITHYNNLYSEIMYELSGNINSSYPISPSSNNNIVYTVIGNEEHDTSNRFSTGFISYNYYWYGNLTLIKALIPPGDPSGNIITNYTLSHIQFSYTRNLMNAQIYSSFVANANYTVIGGVSGNTTTTFSLYGFLNSINQTVSGNAVENWLTYGNIDKFRGVMISGEANINFSLYGKFANEYPIYGEVNMIHEVIANMIGTYNFYESVGLNISADALAALEHQLLENCVINNDVNANVMMEFNLSNNFDTVINVNGDFIKEIYFNSDYQTAFELIGIPEYNKALQGTVTSIFSLYGSYILERHIAGQIISLFTMAADLNQSRPVVQDKRTVAFYRPKINKKYQEVVPSGYTSTNTIGKKR